MKLTRKVNAILPFEMEEKTLQYLRIGESTWTVPWAMWVDRNRLCWLHPTYTAHNTPGGTVQMRVTRLEDGYHVELPRGEKFTPQEGPSYAGQSQDTPWIPVISINAGTDPCPRT